MPPPPSQTGKEWEEGTGESSSPPRSSSGHHDLRHSIFERLAGKQGESDPSSFWVKLCAHFDRLPDRYLTDLGVDKAEDVLLHRRVLDEVQNGNLPVFEARFIEVPTRFCLQFIPKLANSSQIQYTPWMNRLLQCTEVHTPQKKNLGAV
jgi:serine/threonine-protein kinase TNNI3K